MNLDSRRPVLITSLTPKIILICVFNWQCTSQCIGTCQVVFLYLATFIEPYNRLALSQSPHIMIKTNYFNYQIILILNVILKNKDDISYI